MRTIAQSHLLLGSVVVLVGLTGASAAAKPLYITVPRSFGTAENPVVEVAFAGRQPVELRVLKPQDSDAFIAAQDNLRRAYRPPSTTVNPGRYLTRGLNLLRSPADYLLLALDPELRQAVAPALPERPPVDDHGLSQLREGPPKLVGLPDGFEVVRRRWLNLDLGGPQRDFNVPGFTPEYVDSGFEERRVVLDPLPAGVYLLQLVQERIEGQVLLVVTDLSVQVKQTDGRALVRVAGRDKRPRAGVQVRLHGAGMPDQPVTTNADGEAWLEVDRPRLLLSARQGADLAVVDTDFYSALAAAPDVFIYTDRPIYRPGDTAQFRGLLRQPDGFLARLFTPRRNQVRVELLAGDSAVRSVQVAVDDFGSFAGELKVPEGLDTGVLRLLARVDDQQHQAEARVQEYVKPTFYLELDSAQETVRPGETLRATIRARRYAGGVPAATRYEVFLYRTVLSTPSWVDDAGLGGRGSAVTYGSSSTNEGELSIPKRLYSSVAERGVESDPWDSAPGFDAEGNAEIAIEVPALQPGEERLPFKYSLTVRARDDQGTFANKAKTFYFAASEVMAALSPSAKVVIEGGEAQLAIKSISLSGKTLPAIAGELRYLLRSADGGERQLGQSELRTDETGVWRGAVPTGAIGTVVAQVTLRDAAGKPWQGETTLLVAGRGGEAVRQVPALTLETLASTLSPGDSAELVVLLPRGWGEGGRERGSLWITLEGRELYTTRRLELDGQTLIHRFAIEKRFGSAVYASVAYPTATGRWEERTAPFRIIPVERALRVAVTPRVLEAAPGSPQTLDLRVTDHLGRGVAAQLSVGVVDQAVYALQGEFRPAVLEFFYPLVRNNVSSFFSNEFQGYGYGEVLARAAARLEGRSFAAVKPPTRRKQDDERDTAFWTARLRTDEQGRATVSFALPGNQTLWTVTAVAADAIGRFGESTAEFASRGQLNLVAALPRFLRVGDQAEASVRVARGARGRDDKVGLQVEVGGSLTAAQLRQDVALPASGETVVPFTLAAAKAGEGTIVLGATGAQGRVGDRRGLEVQPAEILEELQVSAYGGGTLDLAVPAGARVEAVELQLAPSTVELALGNVHELLQYPYGCLEQLVATTVPNLAVYRTLERLGTLDRLDPDSRALLTEARSRASQGIERILKLAVKGGGFTWFGGYSTPSLELTLIALDGLAQAVPAGLVDARDRRLLDSLRWLEAQTDLPLPLEATQVYVLAQHQRERAAPRVRALVERAATDDLYTIALAGLAAEQAGVLAEALVQEKLAALVQAGQGGIGRYADFQVADAQAFWRFPLRRIGLAALLAHAAALGPLDVDAARQGLLSLVAEAGELSTFDRSMFLLHSLWLLERDAKAMRAMSPPAVQADGKRVAALAPRGGGLGGTLSSSTRQVSVAEFDGVATLRARVWLPVDQAPARAEGMEIRRDYFVVTEQGPRPLASGDSVAQGQEIYVQLTLDAHPDERWRGLRSAYYLVEDRVPAGFEPLLEDKRFEGAPHGLVLRHEALKRRALNADRALFFFEEPAWWSRSPRVVGYVLRAQFAGRFSAPPAEIRDMYAPQVHGRSAPATLSVTAVGAR